MPGDRIDLHKPTPVTSVLGTPNRITVTPGPVVTVDIAPTYVGQASITTLGTITTGVWNGTTIDIAHGGTGQITAILAFNALSPLTTLGDTLYHDGANNVRLAGNTTIIKKYLSETGTGVVSAAPTWEQVDAADLSGVLPILHGGTGQTTAVLAFNALSPLTTDGDMLWHDGFNNVRLGGNTTVQVMYLKSQGLGFGIATAPQWAQILSTEINNTTFVTSVTGTLNRISSTGGLTPVIDIDAAYVGQASITTLGTIATGIWSATTIALNKGGTGQTLKADAFDALSPMTTLGDIIYGGPAPAGRGTRLGGNTTATVMYLKSLGVAGLATAPVWAQILSTEINNTTFVPYTGATANVDLGIHSITATGATVQNAPLTVSGAMTNPNNFAATITASVSPLVTGVAYGMTIIPTLTAAFNNDRLEGLHVVPTYVNNGKTGVFHAAAYFQGTVQVAAGDLSLQNGTFTIFGTATAIAADIPATVNAAGALGIGLDVRPALVATANGDTLIGLQVWPGFNDAGHTPVTHFAAVFYDNVYCVNDVTVAGGINVGTATGAPAGGLWLSGYKVFPTSQPTVGKHFEGCQTYTYTADNQSKKVLQFDNAGGGFTTGVCYGLVMIAVGGLEATWANPVFMTKSYWVRVRDWFTGGAYVMTSNIAVADAGEGATLTLANSGVPTDTQLLMKLNVFQNNGTFNNPTHVTVHFSFVSAAANSGNFIVPSMGDGVAG